MHYLPFAALLLAASVSLAQAGAKPVTEVAGPVVSGAPSKDLDIKTFSKDQIRLRFKDACVYKRGRAVESTVAVVPDCACYANRVIADLTAEELDAYKATRKFNASAEAKAQAAYEACTK